MASAVGAAVKTDIRSLSLKTCLGWGSGTIAVAALFNAVNVLLLPYLVDLVGISAGLAGTLIGLSKLYDAIIDPAIGAASDRSRSPRGRRRPFILVGGVLLAIAAILLFNVPKSFHGMAVIGYVVFALLVYATAYATFSVPYMAMPAEMTADYHERSYLISFRVYGVALASLLAVFVGPVIIGALGGGQSGHSAMSVLLAVVILVATLFCYKMTASAPFHAVAKPAPMSFRRKLAMIAGNRPFLLLLAIKLLQLMALAVTQASMPFLFKRVLHLGDAMLGLYFLAFYGVMILSQPLWVRAGRHFGKRAIFLWITIIYAIAFLSWYFVTPSDPIVFLFVRGIVLGAMGGGVLLFGQSLLPDTMEWDYRQTGLRREGILAGIYTIAEKLAYALGSAITGIVLGMSGYIQGGKGVPVIQPQTAIHAIFVLASIAPMVLLLASCVALWFYDLSEAKLARPVTAG